VDMIEKARKSATDLTTFDQKHLQEHKRPEKPGDPEARLLEITDLLNKSLITTDEYHRKRDEILSSI
jgi:hypothetical protein